MPSPPKDSTTATLLVSCDDRPGLVAALSQLLFALGLNILDADQHTDSVAEKFFQRIRFDLAVGDGTSVIDEKILEGAIREVADRFQMEWMLRLDRDVPRMAIFASVSAWGGESMRITSCSRASVRTSLSTRQPCAALTLGPNSPSDCARRWNQLSSDSWGSMSTTATRSPCSRKAIARCAASVVLPAPPFCCATVKIFAVMSGIQ